MQLALRQVDFGGRTLGVEQPRAHADRDLVQIADLTEDLVGGLAEPDESALLRQRAAVAKEDVLLREATREHQGFFARAPGQRTSVRESRVVPGLIVEPQSADVLDSVEDNATGDVEAPTIVLECRDMRLYGLFGHGAYWTAGGGAGSRR